MKSHSKRIRAIRRLALAGCVAALTVPASASAMLPDGGPDRVQQQSQQPYTLPSGWHPEVQKQSPAQGFQLSKDFRPEVQKQSPAQAQTFQLRRDFRPEVQTQSPSNPAAPAPSIVRQIETVTDDGGRTLAIVLASIALAVALGSLAYATIRLTQIQRREVGSH